MLPKPKKALRVSKPIARTSRPRARRKGKLAELRRKANRLWGEIVRKPGRCECCGSTERIQAAHGFGKKAYPSVRYLPLNGFALAASCHVRYTHKPLEWDDFLRKQWGEEVYQELRRLALITRKCSVPEMEEIIHNLKLELG